MGKTDAPGQNKQTTIYVNTAEHAVSGPTVSFEDIVQLAFPNGNALYTVSYSGGKGGKEGSLRPGKKVPAEEGMMFDVTPTDKS